MDFTTGTYSSTGTVQSTIMVDRCDTHGHQAPTDLITIQYRYPGVDKPSVPNYQNYKIIKL